LLLSGLMSQTPWLLVVAVTVPLIEVVLHHMDQSRKLTTVPDMVCKCRCRTQGEFCRLPPVVRREDNAA
jgi:hypothetical protein